MNRTIHIIHPKDSTTDFLEEIYRYLLNLKDSSIKIYRIDNRENHAEIFTLLPELPDNDLILFFSHGTSTALSGAVTSDYEYPVFISENQLRIFKNKEIILLSCRSNQYLKKFYKDSNLKTAIGFPNMITDYDEVQFHDDPNRVSDISREDIDKYRAILVDTVRFSLEDFIMAKLSITELFNRIKLRLNKKVISFYMSNANKGKLPLGKMINDLVDDMEIYRNF